MEADRDDRARRLPGWDPARLRAATVVLAGVGALGNVIAQQLALAGVGRLVLVDPDRVAATNLPRCPLFTAADVDRPKVEAAARALHALAPELAIDAREGPIERALGLGALRDADLVVAGLDSRAARLALAARRGLVGTPWIDAGTGDWSGEVRVYGDPRGACYGCGLDAAARARGEAPWACGEGAPAGAAGPLSATVGALAALLAVRRLMGLPVADALHTLDATTGAVRLGIQARAADCPFHTPLGPAPRLSLGGDAPVGALLDAVAPGAPLAWHPFAWAARCPRCGHEAPVGAPRPSAERAADAPPCPRCGAALRLRTTLELRRAPRELPLAALGIPPRELLPVRDGAGMRWVELG